MTGDDPRAGTQEYGRRGSPALRLSRVEFERGVIAWDDQRLPVRTRTFDAHGRPSAWSELLRDHTGSVVQSPPGSRAEIDFDVGIKVPRSILPQTYWSYHNDRGIYARVVTPSIGRDHTFQHALGYGVHHRLVIYTPHLDWDEDFVLWQRDLVIRFTSQVSGHRVRPIASIEDQSDEPQLSLEYGGPHILTGRFVEFIAGGVCEAAGSRPIDEQELQHAARSRTEAAWGLMMIQLGESAVGTEIAFSQYITTNRQGGYAISLALMLRKPNEVSVADQELLAEVVPGSLPRDDKNHTVQTALRWYAHGLQAADFRDQLLAFHVGTEGIVRDYASRNGLRAVASIVAEHEDFESLLSPMARHFGQDAVDALVRRSRNRSPTTRECVELYVTDHKLDPRMVREFVKISGLRNPASHGSAVAITEGQAQAARDLLARILRVELEKLSGSCLSPT
jgi:hypothetical protein